MSEAPTGTRGQLLRIKAAHQDHAGNPGHACDACRLLELLERHREAMTLVIEGFSKAQVDPAGMSAKLREGLGR